MIYLFIICLTSWLVGLFFACPSPAGEYEDQKLRDYRDKACFVSWGICVTTIILIITRYLI